MAGSALFFSSLFQKLGSSSISKETVIALTIFFTLLCACIVIGHLLEENQWANESITALLWDYVLDLLSCWSVKARARAYLISVRSCSSFICFLLSFSMLGAFFLLKRIGMASLRVQDYLAIGAILSATDSVCTLQVLSQDKTPLLYSLVFGEGVVNDATSIVLFNAVQTVDLSSINAFISLKLFGTFLYLYLTSTALGIAVGLISAYIIKTLYFGRHSTDREVAVMMLMAYLSYMLAELLSLSGILTIFFCGIVMSHYTWHNVTESSRITTKHAFATMSFIAETFIFLYVGMDALDIDKWKASHTSSDQYASTLWTVHQVLGEQNFNTNNYLRGDESGIRGISIAISLTLLALVLVGRAAFVFLLANIANYFKRRESAKITLREQFIIWWAGLMRGAVTIALSYDQFTGSGSTSTSTEDRARMIT
ncbi:sodium/hydrogen exchanger 2-like [Telopea speciosissima]|uniref:sodium/hydrogen exchanger 2-like n=1 Tax=Telopea speciosissima TaxID=54955 RepID=UPI001CC47E0D|nr:sodium/hydrogen exchanger 2-like [Telopea speciosissima]